MFSDFKNGMYTGLGFDLKNRQQFTNHVEAEQYSASALDPAVSEQ